MAKFSLATLVQMVSEVVSKSGHLVFAYGAFWIAVYWHALFVPYAYHDDFMTIPWSWDDKASCHTHPLYHVLWAYGRPLGASIVCWTNRFYDDFSSIAFVRFLSIGVLTFFSAGMHLFLRGRFNWPLAATVTSIFGLFSLPWTVAAIGYANQFVIILSAFLSFCGALWMDSGVRESNHGNRSLRLWFGASLIFIALLIYQPPSMWAFSVIGIVLLFENRPLDKRVRHALRLSVGTGLILGIYFLIGRLWFITSFSVSASDPWLLKTQWFVTQLLKDAFSLWIAPGSSKFAALIGAFVLVGLSVPIWTTWNKAKQPRLALLFLATCLGLTFAASAPTLLMNVRDGSYRNMGAQSAWVWFLMIFSSMALLNRFSEKEWFVTFRQAGCLVVIVLGTLSAHFSIRDGVAYRTRKELDFAKTSILKEWLGGHKEVAIVQIEPSHLMLGRPMASNELWDVPWTYRNDLIGLFSLLYREMGISTQNLEVVNSPFLKITMDKRSIVIIPKIKLKSELDRIGRTFPIIDFETRITYPARN